MSDARASFTAEETRRIGETIGVDWASVPFDVEQLRMGMDVELEHGRGADRSSGRCGRRWAP